MADQPMPNGIGVAGEPYCFYRDGGVLVHDWSGNDAGTIDEGRFKRNGDAESERDHFEENAPRHIMLFAVERTIADPLEKGAIGRQFTLMGA